MRGAVVIAISLILVAPLAAAPRASVAASAIITELTGCTALTDNATRLACFDAATAKLAAATAKGDVKIIDREEMRATRRSLFGFDLPRIGLFKGDDSAADTPSEIDTVVKSVASEPYGHFVLTMDDGAAWRTAEPLPRDPKAGAKVHLKRGALGNYFMTVGSMRSVRAQRVR